MSKMNRRSLLSLIAGLPLVGRLVKAQPQHTDFLNLGNWGVAQREPMSFLALEPSARFKYYQERREARIAAREARIEMFHVPRK